MYYYLLILNYTTIIWKCKIKTIEVVLKEIEEVAKVDFKEVDLVTKDKGIKEEEISTTIKKIRFAHFWASLPGASIVMTHQDAILNIQFNQISSSNTQCKNNLRI